MAACLVASVSCANAGMHTAADARRMLVVKWRMAFMVIFR